MDLQETIFTLLGLYQRLPSTSNFSILMALESDA